jgi:hypothetical protein
MCPLSTSPRLLRHAAAPDSLLKTLAIVAASWTRPGTRKARCSSEAVVDPHEPPTPPKVTLDQSENLAKSLAKGTLNRKQIALTIASDKSRDLV